MSELRELLGTTRKYSVPIGEYLDRIGLTIRDGDLRRLNPTASQTPLRMKQPAQLEPSKKQDVEHSCRVERNANENPLTGNHDLRNDRDFHRRSDSSAQVVVHP